MPFACNKPELKMSRLAIQVSQPTSLWVSRENYFSEKYLVMKIFIHLKVDQLIYVTSIQEVTCLLAGLTYLWLFKKSFTCLISSFAFSSRLKVPLFCCPLTCDCKRICDISSFKRPFKTIKNCKFNDLRYFTHYERQNVLNDHCKNVNKEMHYKK